MIKLTIKEYIERFGVEPLIERGETDMESIDDIWCLEDGTLLWLVTH